jgi:hypothetical protein
VNGWLDNPAVQAGIVPLAVALVVGLLLARTRFLAAGVVAGLAILLALTIGFALEPMTSVRKLIVVTFAAGALALVLEAAGVAARRSIVGAIAGVGGLASVWIVLRVLQQKETGPALVAGLGAAVFVGAVVAAALACAADPLRGSVIGTCLGWGSGALAVLGASALLGQIGIALGTACAALALAQMLRGGPAPAGWTTALPAGLGAALVGVGAVVTGELRWYFLLPLLLVPFAVRLVPGAASRRPWQHAFLAGFAALVPVVAAIGWAWMSARMAGSAG